MNPTPKEITETLDRAEFAVLFDHRTNTWSIIDEIDEDGFREFDIPPEQKEQAILSAYEFVIENIFREQKKEVDEKEKSDIYILPTGEKFFKL